MEQALRLYNKAYHDIDHLARFWDMNFFANRHG